MEHKSYDWTNVAGIFWMRWGRWWYQRKDYLTVYHGTYEGRKLIVFQSTDHIFWCLCLSIRSYKQNERNQNKCDYSQKPCSFSHRKKKSRNRWRKTILNKNWFSWITPRRKGKEQKGRKNRWVRVHDLGPYWLILHLFGCRNRHNIPSFDDDGLLCLRQSPHRREVAKGNKRGHQNRWWLHFRKPEETRIHRLDLALNNAILWSWNSYVYETSSRVK